ncbi:phosphate ABC transporter substrate-binding protein [Acetanaerobacterium elongatum]|uniref:Phosphate-binding protein n=1 Tax=Acetanaerobacterium elongatum TaxID=258515 RepID=A0A1H0GXW3_9FIRM|nr:phosphate ABC transporter substrate-binding protein [Acetanaerobacterium elongatum]SDO11720.1 phosphate ABC transporter substrate-binding protein, PhoT family [Acetanaerobacterium elongatum]
MRKILSVVLALAISGALFAGCASTPAAASSEAASSEAVSSEAVSSEAASSAAASSEAASSVDASSSEAASSEAVSSEAASSAAASSKAASSAAASSKAVSSVAASSKAAADVAAKGTGLTGKVTLTGSTSMQELMEAFIEDYKTVEPGVTVECQFVGSGPGITAVTEGKVDIGNASRALKTTESSTLKAHVVAIDGIAIALNPANKVSDLTLGQIASIYKGEVKNWKDVGGADAAIVVIGRDSASGTREAFESIVNVKDKCKYSQELTSTGAVQTAVASNANAIGYISLNAVNSKVKACKVGGAEATDANIIKGTYALSRPFVMATNSTKTLSAPAQAFLDYAMGAKGQAVVKSIGLISKK